MGDRKCKAVLFDLFETLVTEWGHKKYTKREMCADLGVDKEAFDPYWEEKEQARYLGDIDFEGSIEYACEACGRRIDKATMELVADKRRTTKSECFSYVLPEVLELLRTLRKMGLKTAIVSNCSAEEVHGLRESEIGALMDEIVLSFKVHMRKPDPDIYGEAVRRLGVTAEECIFVGDGGSNELVGARNAGIRAIQAKWYTDRFPVKRDTIEGFPAAEEPSEITTFTK